MQTTLKDRLPLHTFFKNKFEIFKFLTGISENNCFGVCKCNLTLQYLLYDHQGYGKKQCKI